MRPDKVPEGGKWREVASSSLDGTAGTWGDATTHDLLCVLVDSSGEIDAADLADAEGVIWTLEGEKRASSHASYGKVIGGKRYTVFRFAEFAEADTADDGSTALAAGDKLYAGDAGIITTSPSTGAVYIGYVSGDGKRLIVDVGSRPASA